MVGDLKRIKQFISDREFNSYYQLHDKEQKLLSDQYYNLTEQEIEDFKQWGQVKDIYDKQIPAAVNTLNQYQKEYENVFKALKLATKRLEDAQKLQVFYQESFDELSQQYLDSLSNMLTECYREVHEDNTRSIKLVMIDYRAKKVLQYFFKVPFLFFNTLLNIAYSLYHIVIE